jgi:hypothetical protein
VSDHGISSSHQGGSLTTGSLARFLPPGALAGARGDHLFVKHIGQRSEATSVAVHACRQSLIISRSIKTPVLLILEFAIVAAVVTAIVYLVPTL